VCPIARIKPAATMAAALRVDSATRDLLASKAAASASPNVWEKIVVMIAAAALAAPAQKTSFATQPGSVSAYRTAKERSAVATVAMAVVAAIAGSANNVPPKDSVFVRHNAKVLIVVPTAVVDPAEYALLGLYALRTANALS